MTKNTEYTVVPCKNCDNIWIVQGTPNETTCTLCNERYKFKKLKKLFQTNDKEKAREARALKQAEINGIDHIFKSLLEDGEFDKDVTKSVIDKEYLRKKGINPSIVEDDEKEDNKSKEGRIKDIIDKLDKPTDENIVKKAKEYGISEEKSKEIVDKMCRDGRAMRKRNGEIRIL